MTPREALAAPLARVGLWLPLATLAAFGLLAAAGLLAFPDAVLAVTFLAALGWVAVGFGGDRLGVEGPSVAGTDADADESLLAGPVDATTGLLAYLTATTALGWAVLLAVVGL